MEAPSCSCGTHLQPWLWTCRVRCKSRAASFTWLCVGVGADGGSGNSSEAGVCYPDMPICLPCRPGCGSCRDATPCWVQEAWLLRASVLALQAVFMVLIFVSMLVAYKHRRSRVSQHI